MKMKIFFRYEDEDFFSPIGTVDAADSEAVIERAIRQHICRFDDSGQQMILEIRPPDDVLEVIEVIGLRNIHKFTPPAAPPSAVS